MSQFNWLVLTQSHLVVLHFPDVNKRRLLYLKLETELGSPYRNIPEIASISQLMLTCVCASDCEAHADAVQGRHHSGTEGWVPRQLCHYQGGRSTASSLQDVRT